MVCDLFLYRALCWPLESDVIQNRLQQETASVKLKMGALKMKLAQINLIVDIPELNRFNIGDKVIASSIAGAEHIEAIVIGIELKSLNSTDVVIPNITLLDGDGNLKSGFKPRDLLMFHESRRQ